LVAIYTSASAGCGLPAPHERVIVVTFVDRDVDCIAGGWKHEIRPLSGDGRAEKSLGSLQASPSRRGTEEAADLLDDFLIALLELPGDA
jgi:hypothetical protein